MFYKQGELFGEEEMHDCYFYSSRKEICFWMSTDPTSWRIL